jgi:hypothetical protein
MCDSEFEKTPDRPRVYIGLSNQANQRFREVDEPTRRSDLMGAVRR